MLGHLRGRSAALCLSGALVFAGIVQAAEVRDWTDTQGRTVKAEYLRQDPQTVWLKRADGREVAVPKKTLSEGDQVFLRSLPADAIGAGATPAAAKNGSATFNNVRIDPSQFKPKEGGVVWDNLTLSNTLQSPHFLVATTEKAKPQVLAVYAEVGERLFSDLAADFPSLVSVCQGKVMPLILINNDAEAKLIEVWHAKHTEQSPRYIYHDPKLGLAGISGFTITDDFADEHGLTHFARTFKLDSKTADSLKKTWPQRIHMLTETFMSLADGNAKKKGGYSAGMLAMSVSYEREYAICGRIETELAFSSVGADVEGFKNGKGWAAATKKIISKGAKPDIDAFLKTDMTEAPPRDLGFGLGLIQFLRRSPAKLAGLDKAFAEMESSGDAISAKDFTTALGYSSEEELNTAWLNYMQSSDFQ